MNSRPEKNFLRFRTPSARKIQSSSRKLPNCSCLVVWAQRWMQAQPPPEFPSIAMCATNGSTDLSNGTITDLENVTGSLYLNTALNERWPRPEDEPRQAGPVGAAATAEPSLPGGMSRSREHQLLQQQPHSHQGLGGMSRSREH